MSDNYEDVRSEAKSLRDRFVELELRHQANRAYYAGNYDDYEWTDEEKLRELNRYSNEYRDEIESWFADLEDLFGDLADLPDPERLTSVASSLEPALEKLAGPLGAVDLGNGKQYPPQPNFERLLSMENYLEDWNGLAADAFKSNYMPKFAGVVYYEFHAVASLKSSLLASAAMWKAARQDVSNLIDEANSALDDYEGGKSKADASLAMAIIGAVCTVAAVVAAPATGGASVVLYWTMAAATATATSAALAYPAEPASTLDIKGESPAEICQSLREAVSDMKIQWIYDEGFIRDQLLHLSDTISGYSLPRGSESGPRPRTYSEVQYPTDHTYSEDVVHGFVLPRPALADLNSGNVRDGFGEPEI